MIQFPCELVTRYLIRQEYMTGNQLMYFYAVVRVCSQSASNASRVIGKHSKTCAFADYTTKYLPSFHEDLLVTE